MSNESSAKLKAGRSWKVATEGINSLKREYVVVVDPANPGSTVGADSEPISWTGVPAIGSAHPLYSQLFVKDYDVREGTGADRNTLIVTVNYERNTIMSANPEGSGGQRWEYALESWGWSAGSTQKELVEDKSTDAKPVLNSAGDPFENAPMVEAPAPVFRKVFKTKEWHSGYLGLSCKTNDSAITIGDMTCAVGTLLIQVGVEKIVADATWKYRWSAEMKYNPDGWDLKIIDCGMRALVDYGDDTKKQLCTVVDSVTGKSCAVTSPALLDGQGHQVSDTAPEPYTLEFQAYARGSVPYALYSDADEPTPSNSNS